MFITKKHLSRRTFLRGAGVTLALPFLESMVPAQTPLRNTAAIPKTRLGCLYVPHGATMYKWTPATEGKGFQFSETLSPLEKYRDRVNVVSNLCHQSASGADAGGEHARSAAIFLSRPNGLLTPAGPWRATWPLAARSVRKHSAQVAEQFSVRGENW